MPAPEIVGLPFAEAISFFRQKLNLPTQTWTDLWQGMHARAFVVAGAMKDGLVADLRLAVDKAIAEGTTLAEFRADFDTIVAEHGWSYKGGRGFRTRTIFNTNLTTAYAAGRWQQTQRVKGRRPYLRYVAVLDGRTRVQHAGWHGTVLPVDAPWWQTHYPPNGWYCRCTTQTLSARDAARFGHEVSEGAPPVRLTDRTINTPGGPAKLKVPDGIDPGFSHNVGEAAFGRGQQLLALERHGPFTPLTAPGGGAGPAPAIPATAPRAAIGPRARSEAGLRAALRGAIGGDEKIFTDPAGGRVQIGQGLVDHMPADTARRDGREAFFPLIPELIEDPDEILIGFARSEISGRVAIRRRYVRMLDLGRSRVLGMIADADGGMWSGLTFFAGAPSRLRRLREGAAVLYRKE